MWVSNWGSAFREKDAAWGAALSELGAVWAQGPSGQQSLEGSPSFLTAEKTPPSPSQRELPSPGPRGCGVDSCCALSDLPNFLHFLDKTSHGKR